MVTRGHGRGECGVSAWGVDDQSVVLDGRRCMECGDECASVGGAGQGSGSYEKTHEVLTEGVEA